MPPRGTALFVGLLVASLAITSATQAQNTESDLRAVFDSLIAAHSYDITFDGETISGPGADWLLHEADLAQYFLIGERHATAEIPALSGALYAQMTDAGYTYAALEIGPIAGKKTNALLRSGGFKALETFLTTEPARDAIAFLNWREEAQMAARIVNAGGTIWGLDQEFIFSDRWHLSRLSDMAQTEAQRHVVDSLRTASREIQFFLGRAEPAAFERLRDVFAGHPSEEVHAVIEALLFTNSVYRPFLRGGPVSRANIRRENYMKRNLVSNLRRVGVSGNAPPKVFFKFGGFHSAPGIGGHGRIYLGTFVEEWARGHGHEAFNLFIGCNGGQHLSTGGIQHTPQPCASMIAGTGGQNATEVDSSRVFTRLLAEHEDDLWLVDLRPLRDRVAQWDFLTSDETKWIKGFDALLMVPDVTPATPLED